MSICFLNGGVCLIKFNDNYKVGISVIDAQHENFFSILNRFEVAIAEKNLCNLNSILDDIIKYTYYHFITEETFLSKLNSEVNENHKIIHYRIQNNILSLRSRINVSDNPLPLFIELFNISNDYLSEHIIDEIHTIKELNNLY